MNKREARWHCTIIHGNEFRGRICLIRIWCSSLSNVLISGNIIIMIKKKRIGVNMDTPLNYVCLNWGERQKMQIRHGTWNKKNGENILLWKQFYVKLICFKVILQMCPVFWDVYYWLCIISLMCLILHKYWCNIFVLIYSINIMLIEFVYQSLLNLYWWLNFFVYSSWDTDSLVVFHVDAIVGKGILPFKEWLMLTKYKYTSCYWSICF